jgi:hypothetical protein
MQRTKVYLSKSSACSASQLTCVREYLSKLDVEVLEYENEHVFKSNLKKCKYLIVLPPDTTVSSVKIGKGQTIEIESFLEFANESDVLVVSDAWRYLSGATQVIVEEYEDMRLFNFGKSWKQYAELSLCDVGGELKDFIEEYNPGKSLTSEINSKQYESVTDSSMYLLIG